jgi:hypothetical protein
MARYRKKPVEVEAMLFAAPWKPLQEFCGSLQLVRASTGNHVIAGLISTLEGDMRADVGDWIIRGVKGEFYPCKPDIFEATYEPVAS